MDIKIHRQPVPLWKRYWYLLPPFVLCLLAVSVRSMLGDASTVVDPSKIQLARVEKGDLVVNVRGAGVLQPGEQRWVVARVSGRIEHIYTTPGAQVALHEPLVRLSNPGLEGELEQAQLELRANQAESHAAMVGLEMQLLDLEDSLRQAQFTYQTTKLRLDAESELLEFGVLPKIQFSGTQLEVEQRWQSWQAQVLRVEKMNLSLDATRRRVEARLGVMENAVERANRRVAGLVLRAPMVGQVQSVPLELGQQVEIGTKAVLVANEASLMAQLQIQELQVRDIAVGQSVVIDTRASEIAGKVLRIDPASNSGRVQVDVGLVGKLPVEARSELKIEGLIEVSHLINVLFVDRPALVQRYSSAQLYRLSFDGNFASKVPVEIGQSSVGSVEIVSGLKEGDQIIVSDTSDWDEHREILIH